MEPNTQPPIQTPVPETGEIPSPLPTLETPSVQPPVLSPKKKGVSKVFLLFFMIMLVALGAGGYFFFKNKNNIPVAPIDENARYKEHTFEEFPEVSGIPITENTISFVKADGKFCLLYKNIVYIPQDTGSLTPRTKEFSDEMKSFPWLGLIDAPEGVKITSFKESPSNKSFVFILEAKVSEVEKYEMFRFFNNSVSELRVFSTKDDGLYFIPKLYLFSLGGNFMNLNMFTCQTCLSDMPETLLYYIPTGESRNIGKVQEFTWGEDDNVYSYKEYKEGIDPKDLPLRTNDFFKKSVDLLTP